MRRSHRQRSARSCHGLLTGQADPLFGRYALAVGRGAHRRQLEEKAERAGLVPRAINAELLLAASPGTPFLASGTALIIGQLFDEDAQRLTMLPPAVATVGLANPADTLRPHWGNFALFHADRHGSAAYRDPSGSVSVYRCGVRGATIFVSDAGVAERLDLLANSTIDRRFVVHWLQYPFLRTARSGWSGVTELLPGMHLVANADGDWTERRGWHPSAFVSGGAALDDPVTAASRLREVARAVVAAQPVPGPIGLRLSGGLDSSIIAACLVGRGFDPTGLNFATRGRDGDERTFARLVARQAGLTLHEVGEPASSALEPQRQRSFRPMVNPLLAPFERALDDAARTLGLTLLIDGTGGDNLFGANRSSAAVIDALRQKGPRQALATLGDVATRASCTHWEVLQALRRRLVRPRTTWKEDRSFLDPGACLREPEIHPWLEGRTALPGKREHVEALVHIQHFLDRSDSSIGRLHPLLAQPLLELCLRIPSWLWTRGGRDRAIARDAFAGLVPDAVLQRRLKGSLQSMLYRSFEQQRGAMRDLLLGGVLAEQRIIVPAELERAMVEESWKADDIQLRISEIVALEQWLQVFGPVHVLRQPSAMGGMAERAFQKGRTRFLCPTAEHL